MHLHRKREVIERSITQAHPRDHDSREKEEVSEEGRINQKRRKR